jgi:hypothetical protein
VSFLNDAHNDVNARLGKRVVSLEEHYHRYSLSGQREHTYLVGACVAAVCGGVAYYCYYYYRHHRRHASSGSS